MTFSLFFVKGLNFYDNMLKYKRVTDVEQDIYIKLFMKMAKLGFPEQYKGCYMFYDYKNYQADVKLFPTVKKIYKMWELLK